jgi:cardiolipin synthase C
VWQILSITALLGSGVLLAGCGTLPTHVERSVTQAIPPQASGALQKIAHASTPPGELSGFRLLPLGAYAIDARLQLARRAEYSLDVQYYTIENDATGLVFLRHLRDAAQRGVRVRLLVDDLFTADTNEILRSLAAHPNVEVRLFNPFCCARASLLSRVAGSLFDLHRLNHRMHNKMFIADGVMAVAGGRNIGNEYFMRSGVQNFVDMDALVMGAVLREMAIIFDRYWSSEVVYPVQSIIASDQTAQTLTSRFDELTQAADEQFDLPSVDILGYGPVSEELASGRLGLIWAPASAIADPPDKPGTATAEAASKTSVTNDLRMKIWGAKKELVLTSPYLIPGPKGIETFQALCARQVKMTVITNSLAATDETLVHAGYSRYRYPMLLAGVDLYELSPERTRLNKRLGLFGKSRGRLHAKTAIVDEQLVFLGSMNLDPRSETQNTEFALFIDSPELARELQRILRITKLQSAYRLRLSPETGDLQWLTMDEDVEVVLNDEPESSLWMRFHNLFLAPLVPEQLL